jgi:hypothetical protein
MTIRAAVLEMLRERFSDRPFAVADPESDVIASFDAPYSELGRLVIEDDGDEVTVYLGTVTHGHFSAFHESQDRRPAAIADLLGSFLEDLFSDQIVAYSTGLTHGWQAVGDETITKRRGRQQFFWSRRVV